jgi:hypothetical protein
MLHHCVYQSIIISSSSSSSSSSTILHHHGYHYSNSSLSIGDRSRSVHCDRFLYVTYFLMKMMILLSLLLLLYLEFHFMLLVRLICYITSHRITSHHITSYSLISLPHAYTFIPPLFFPFSSSSSNLI